MIYEKKTKCFHWKKVHKLPLSFFSVYNIYCQTICSFLFCEQPINQTNRTLEKMNQRIEVIFCKHFIPFSYFTHPLFYKILQILYEIVGSMQDKLVKYWMSWQGSNLFIKTNHIDYLHKIHVYLFIYNVESYSSAKFDVQTVQTNWYVCVFHGM